jgi:hypothetical protein
VYIAKIVPHCLRFDWQATARACSRTRCKAGINIAINRAIIAITTKSSISVNPVINLLLILLEIFLSNGVKPYRFCIVQAFRLKVMHFADCWFEVIIIEGIVFGQVNFSIWIRRLDEVESFFLNYSIKDLRLIIFDLRELYADMRMTAAVGKSEKKGKSWTRRS